ncbi:MAG: penicillin-binding protein 1C [Proteobacteria bacterium]|nr:penicillin-binding protein 1C [Pseudomonadota bacterium]
MLKKIKQLLLVLLLLLFIFLLLDFLWPLPIENFNQRSFAQVVVDQDGQPLRAFPDSQGVWRYPIKLDDVSPLYVQALINYEDKYFYQHFGVNPLAVIRAFGQWIWQGKLVSGASTLTMQVARILKPHKKSFTGKAAQMFRALQLEWHFSKKEILEFYLNYAPFGGTIEGVEAASYAYFGKKSSALTHSEAALLAVMPQSPSRFRPDRYPQRAKKARDKLLNRLLKLQIWTQQIIAEAQEEEVWASYNTRPMIAPLLARRLRLQYPQQQVIKSTIDLNLQVELEALVKNYIASKANKMSAALLLIDNQDMSTQVYIGSADFLDKTRAGSVDMIQATRSPGSTLKPFIYAMAIDQGIIHSESLLLDVPQSFSGYRPINFTDKFNGAVSVSQALGRSLNMPAVQVLNEISPEFFYAKLNNAGLNIKLPINAKPNLSLALGGGGVTLQQLVAVFSSLGRDGNSAPVQYIMTDDKSYNKPANFPLLSKGSAWIVQNILSHVPMQAIRSRHFNSVNSTNSIAYKTGTSYGFRDAWVIASNKKITIGIWLGNADGSFLEKNSGRTAAVPLLQQVLAMLHSDMMQTKVRPLNVVDENICWPLGGKAKHQSVTDCHKTRRANLLDGTAPATLKDSLSTQYSSGLLTIQLDKKTNKRVLPSCYNGGIETKQIAIWPMLLEPWLAKKYRRDTILPEFSQQCRILQATNNLTITGVHNHAIIYPEAQSNNMPEVQLQLEGVTGKVYWFVNGIMQKTNDKTLTLSNLVVGKYKVKAIDDTASFAEIEFDSKL